MTIPIKRALISVSDKTGIIEFASALQQLGIEILSTGGTAKLLAQADINVIEVGDYTGFPEMLDGRVKTLHPRIHGGILFRRDLPEHVAAVDGAGIPSIDLVVVNLYPFSAAIAKADCALTEAIENIDIGGPTLIRAAAKNYSGVAVITDPTDYAGLTHALQTSGGAFTREQRFGLAVKAFSHTAAYDSAISNYLSTYHPTEKDRHTFPGQLNLNFTKAQELRYGENPHQQGAFYRELEPATGTLSHYTQQQGKALSYNNIADSDTAWECVKTFEQPACVIVKHANPCGVAIAENNLVAYHQALATDPSSAFGGIIAFNRPLEADTAEAVIQQFLEVLIAPAVSAAAAQVLAKKPNIRVLTIPLAAGSNGLDYKRVGGGLLVQTPDRRNVEASELRIVSQATPTPQQISDLLFAWRVAKFVKSNAIVFATDGKTLGIGAGQMSRVDSARIAAIKAHNANLDLRDAAVASDAFFPFRDGVDVAAEAGATTIIQPGGSMRDEEVIAAANEHGIAMVFTGTRHFRH